MLQHLSQSDCREKSLLVTLRLILEMAACNRFVQDAMSSNGPKGCFKGDAYIFQSLCASSFTPVLLIN